MKSKEPLHPIDIQLGNFIESIGNVEMVTGIMLVEGKYEVAHTGWHKGESVLPPDVMMETYPCLLTEEWKICLGIEKFDKLPDWIKYVHECQNYFLWALRINLHEQMNWDLKPKYSELN